MTKIGLYDLVKSTTLESNKSLVVLIHFGDDFEDDQASWVVAASA